MGYFLVAITSLLALFFGYSLYTKKKNVAFDEKGMRNFQGSINTLLTDFNRISNTNINVLEEKIKELHEAVEVADEKIKRMNALMADLEIISSRIRKKNLSKEIDLEVTEDLVTEGRKGKRGSTLRQTKSRREAERQSSEKQASGEGEGFYGPKIQATKEYARIHRLTSERPSAPNIVKEVDLPHKENGPTGAKDRDVH